MVETDNREREARLRQESVEGIPLTFESEEIDVKNLELREEVVSLKRVAKVVKGGRRFSFNALVVVGDGNGHVGVGFGKANEVPDAIGKAVEDGKKNMFRVPLVGRTIPHQITGKYGAARVLLKPAAEGTGIIAGPAVRAVMELAGIRDILTKCIGTNNVLNVVRGTAAGLRKLKSLNVVSQRRGKEPKDILGRGLAEKHMESLRALVEKSEPKKEGVKEEEKAKEKKEEKEKLAKEKEGKATDAAEAAEREEKASEGAPVEKEEEKGAVASEKKPAEVKPEEQEVKEPEEPVEQMEEKAEQKAEDSEKEDEPEVKEEKKEEATEDTKEDSTAS